MTAHKHVDSKKHAHHTTQHHHAKHTPTHKPKTLVWVAGGILIVGVLFIFMNYSVSDTKMDTTTPPIEPTPTQVPSSVSADEKKQIDQWIKDNGFNMYGDDKGTVYIGGTPLFNEATGKYRDLYEYVIEQHPDTPWKK